MRTLAGRPLDASIEWINRHRGTPVHAAVERAIDGTRVIQYQARPGRDVITLSGWSKAVDVEFWRGLSGPVPFEWDGETLQVLITGIEMEEVGWSGSELWLRGEIRLVPV